MTGDEIRELAAHAAMPLDVLVDQAMLTVMTGDPNDPRYSLAWQVWTVGQELVKADKRQQMTKNGWVYYPRSENDKPIRCPYCGTLAHLLGGKKQRWTCRKCDALQTAYEPEGGDGFWMRWQTATK